MEKNRKELEIETLELKLKRERENRRHTEDLYEQTKFLLKSAKDDIERLVFQVTHDLRAPISVLGQSVEDVIPHLPLERRNVFLSSVARVQEISNEVLKKHKVNESKDGVDFTKHTVDVIKQTSSLVQENRFILDKSKNITIDLNLNGLDLEPQLANIREMEFNCILSNLLVNSIEAIQEKKQKGQIHVEVKKDGEFYNLKVSDTGIGIKQEVLYKIGNYRATYKPNGNGLGLYSSIHFLKKRGGSFSIESEYGKSTTVFITIPVAGKEKQKIKIQKDGLLVILDDDYLIHETLRLFLREHNFKGEIMNFYTEAEFRNWFGYSRTEEKEKAFFIIDGFIESDYPNGPTIIDDLKISNQAILFTGRSNLIKLIHPNYPVFNKSDDLTEIFLVS